MTTLMAVGGAMDKEDPSIMREFIRRAGGAAAQIVILPQASALADTGEIYVNQCKELGAGQVVSLEFRQRSAMDTPEQIAAIRNATGIFLTGGAQMRIATLYGGTRLEAELLAAYRRGCLVGGTSAGASILSKTMLAYGKGGPTPRERIVQFSPGLGFTDKFIFDQHFRQRDRLGRLIYAVAAYPGALGVGLDEDTAAIVEDDASITVCGSGGVTLVDGRQLGYTDVADVENKGPVAVSNLKIHILTQGCRYQNGTVYIPEKISLDE
jgi:cyanophycinase